jgi:hypothetical protein
MNDGEMVEIERLLLGCGERVLISRQPWGASWDRLEPDVSEELASWRKKHPEGSIYGVELKGSNPYEAIDIDHHRYSGDDRSHPLSSLEQGAAILGVDLDRRQTLAALNDRGYIPAMLAAGASPEEIDEIRRQDRQAQGLTEGDERRARADIARAKWSGRKVILECPAGQTSCHSDRLFGLADEVLYCGPRKWSYEGHRHRELAGMKFAEENWSGGAEARGFFGISAPERGTRDAILSWFG